jgi:hypothetical protein
MGTGKKAAKGRARGRARPAEGPGGPPGRVDRELFRIEEAERYVSVEEVHSLKVGTVLSFGPNAGRLRVLHGDRRVGLAPVKVSAKVRAARQRRHSAVAVLASARITDGRPDLLAELRITSTAR